MRINSAILTSSAGVVACARRMRRDFVAMLQQRQNKVDQDGGDEGEDDHQRATRLV